MQRPRDAISSSTKQTYLNQFESFNSTLIEKSIHSFLSNFESNCSITNCSIVSSLFTLLLLILVLTSIYLTYRLMQKTKQTSIQLDTNFKRILASKRIFEVFGG
jgi:hypothetical protein